MVLTERPQAGRNGAGGPAAPEGTAKRVQDTTPNIRSALLRTFCVLLLVGTAVTMYFRSLPPITVRVNRNMSICRFCHDHAMQAVRHLSACVSDQHACTPSKMLAIKVDFLLMLLIFGTPHTWITQRILQAA